MRMASDSSTSTGQATEGRRVVARSTVLPGMTADEPTRASGHDSIDSDDHDDLEHGLGGTTCAQAGWEVMAPPEEDARVLVDNLPSDDEKGPDAVTLGVCSDQIAGRAFLDRAEARHVADQLLAAADRAAPDD
jgi:hypothetical protein